jgi:uncharacterized protein YecE (DUF72 family)
MYKDWGENFYPKEMKQGHLTYLAGEFNTVEVNSSFYHLPLLSTFENWRRQVPDDFRFAVKMSRYITHHLRLQEAEEPIQTFLGRAKALEEKLAAILIQLPPYLPYGPEDFAAFLKALEKGCEKEGVRPNFALEPRHPSWFELGAAGRLRVQVRGFPGLALVFPHSAKIPSFEPEDNNILDEFVYVRFHGPSEFAASRYGSERLAPWADKIRKWRERGLRVFAYFNNDAHGHAVEDARELKRLVQEDWKAVKSATSRTVSRAARSKA